MRTTHRLFTLILLTHVGLAYSQESKTTQDVLKDLSEKAAKIKTYSTDFDAVANMGAMTMNFGGDMKAKDKLTVMTMNMDMMGQKMLMKMTTDKDGTVWVDMDAMGMKQVMKMDTATVEQMQKQQGIPGMPAGLGGMGGSQNDPRAFAAEFGKSYALEYTGKEKFNDEDVYVLTGKMKDEAKAAIPQQSQAGAAAAGLDLAAMMNSARVKFGVQDGFPRSIEMLDAESKPWMTQTYKNVKINEPMDDATFAYTPPPDVQVMDLGAMMNGTAPADSPSATTPQN